VSEAGGYIDEYNFGTGVFKSHFIGATLPNSAQGIAVLGNNLFVADYASGKVSEFDATTGATLSANYITTGGPVVGAMQLVGNDLFITDSKNGRVSEYDVSGATATVVNLNFITGLTSPQGLAIVVIPEPSTPVIFGGALLLALGKVRSRRPSARQAA